MNRMHTSSDAISALRTHPSMKATRRAIIARGVITDTDVPAMTKQYVQNLENIPVSRTLACAIDHQFKTNFEAFKGGKWRTRRIPHCQLTRIAA
ncbi:MAG: hypothetical protein U1F34_03235 [Gammaproteobacteria bacterium]